MLTMWMWTKREKTRVNPEFQPEELEGQCFLNEMKKLTEIQVGEKRPSTQF